MNNTTVFDNESIWIFEQIFQTLYTVTPNGKGVQPMLATGYTVSADKKTYTFTLRSGVKFSTGQPMTSADVKFSIDQASAADKGWGYINTAVKSVAAPTPSTVVVTLKYPWAPLLADLSLFSNGIVPANYGGKTETQFYNAPVGTGPFKWEYWHKGSALKLVRNPNYWEKGKPYLNSVTWTDVPSDNTRQLQLKGGQAQIDEFPAWLLPPSAHHLLGTDQLGRDTFTRLLYGLRLDLRIAFIAVLLPFVLGTVLGSLAGYFGGWVDTTIMRLVDIVVAFPFYVLIIALVFVLGPGERSIYLAITLVGWVAYARIIRGEILVAKRQDYVTAARSGGLSNVRIMRRHLLPNVITQAFIYGMSDIVQDILAIVTLGYLGLGIPPPTADLGSMINDGQNFLSTHWQLTTFPGLAVVIVGLGLSLTGDGLADLLRPGQ